LFAAKDTDAGLVEGGRGGQLPQRWIDDVLTWCSDNIKGALTMTDD